MSVEAPGCFVMGEEGPLVSALQNLIQNALDHAEGATFVRIDVTTRKRHVVISVTDDGCGVPEPQRQTLFEPFVRGGSPRQRAVAGHGIGLAIVADVARAHRGRAWYEPGPGTGSVFYLSVPLRQAGQR